MEDGIDGRPGRKADLQDPAAAVCYRRDRGVRAGEAGGIAKNRRNCQRIQIEPTAEILKAIDTNKEHCRRASVLAILAIRRSPDYLLSWPGHRWHGLLTARRFSPFLR